MMLLAVAVAIMRRVGADVIWFQAKRFHVLHATCIWPSFIGTLLRSEI